MRVCIEKSTGKLIESQSGGDDVPELMELRGNTLKQNALNARIEDLNITGMVKNHHLARAISDVGMSELRRQLEYKSKFRGCELIIADRFFPSSKICSQCGLKKDVLSLAERTFVCANGCTLINRDENAAKNLLNYGRHWIEGVPKRTQELGGYAQC